MPGEQKRASKIPASTTARRTLPRTPKHKAGRHRRFGHKWAGRSEHCHNSDRRDAGRRARIRAAVGARLRRWRAVR